MERWHSYIQETMAEAGALCETLDDDFIMYILE